MSDRVPLLEGDLRAALEAHERTGVTRNSANLAAFLHGYHTSAQRRRSHAHRVDRAAAVAGPRSVERYREGYRAGSLDRHLGARSRYAETAELGAYASGYRDGVLGLDSAQLYFEELKS